VLLNESTIGSEMSNIRYTKNVLWLKPFVEASTSLVPLDKLKSIMGYKVKKGLSENSFGCLTKYEGERKFRMSIRVHKYEKLETSNKKEHKKVRCETILLTLAHELAHLEHWEHTPEHFKLQGELIIKFYEVLKESGIKDYLTRHPENNFIKDETDDT
jgi:hypothetical protein